MARKKTEPYVQMPRSLLESCAWRAMSRAARRVVDRIAIEHMAHAGTANGKLIVRKIDFVGYGVEKDGVAPALREACALGIIIMTKRGRAGNAEHRAPHQWALAFIKDKRSGAMLSTTWKRFQSLQEAKAIAAEARAAKDTKAVELGRRSAAKAKRDKLKVIHFPVRKTRSETGPGNPDHSAGPGNPVYFLYLECIPNE